MTIPAAPATPDEEAPAPPCLPPPPPPIALPATCEYTGVENIEKPATARVVAELPGMFRSPLVAVPPLPGEPTPETPPPAPPLAVTVVILCVPLAMLLFPPAPPATPELPLAVPPLPTVTEIVFPEVRLVSHLIAVAPPPPANISPLVGAPAVPPPPPTSVTFTLVIPEGMVNVPLEEKTCVVGPTYPAAGAVLCQVVPLEVRTFPAVPGATV